jgi:hypothetical protein
MQDAIAIQSLKTDIALLRQHIHPPQYLEHVEGLPIYYGLKDEVDEYRQWQPLIERAQQLCQPFMEDDVVDAIHLPSHLNLPLFFFHVDRIRINKTRAKESKTFRGVAALLEKCGQFETDQIFAMQEWLGVMILRLWWHIVSLLIYELMSFNMDKVNIRVPVFI